MGMDESPQSGERHPQAAQNHYSEYGSLSRVMQATELGKWKENLNSATAIME